MIPSNDKKTLDKLVNQVVSLSLRNVQTGGLPFSALIIDKQGNVIGSGVNQVCSYNDPTAHAEIIAIRNACKHIANVSLDNAILIASGEPCALCYMAALCSGISQIIFAVDRDKAADAGFDYRWAYDMLGNDMTGWPITICKHETKRSYDPFEAWIDQSKR